MASVKPLVSTIIANQFPEFMQGEYPKFIAFLEAYYRFLEENDKRDFTDLRSIDSTLDEFVDTIRNELDINGLRYDRSTEQIFLKNIKQLYLAKGSESSYKVLFRLLFNKEVSLYYPNTAILRPSDGKWQQDTSLLVQTVSGDAYGVVGSQLTINTQTKKIVSLVERVRVTPYPNIFEIFLEKNLYGNIDVGSTVTFGSYTGIVQPTLVSYKVEVPGKRFKVGQLFDIATLNGSGLKVKVKRVDENGGIKNLEILQFGYGYVDSVHHTINPVLNTVEEFDPFDDKTEGLIDSGFVNKTDYVDHTYVDGTYSGRIVAEFYRNTKDDNEDESVQALVTFNIGAVCRYPGYFNGNDGFISDTIKIQDSFYYQNYSYVIQIDETLEKYKDIVKRYIHPAGMKMFGEYQIFNEFDLRPTLRFILNFFRVIQNEEINAVDVKALAITKVLAEALSISDSSSVNLGKSFGHSVTATEESTLTTTKSLRETLTVTDELVFEAAFERAYEEVLILSDAHSLELSKEFFETIVVTDDGASFFIPVDNADSFTVTEELSASVLKALEDTLIIEELPIFEATKYIEETSTITDSGGVYLNYYTEPDVWDAEYSEGGRNF